jgi:hypothetical protein
MNRLNTELSRLYWLSEDAYSVPQQLVAASGYAMLSVVWRQVQTELELPAAAIAVSGTDGLQLWFSVAEPVKATDATNFLLVLQSKYLSATPTKRISLYPSCPLESTDRINHAKGVPAMREDTGHWSAFVSPDLASVFGNEPWLDLAPNQNQQADLLCKLQSMTLQQFHDVLGLLDAPIGQFAQPADANMGAPCNTSATPPRYAAMKFGPQEFLAMVMNDPAVALQDRIEAAKALLPYTK